MAEILNIGNIMTPDKYAGAEKEAERKAAERSLNGSRGSKDKKDLEPSLQIGKKPEVPIWHKTNLTLEETAAYSGIGINKLREITDKKDCNFVLFIGRKRLIKRRQFEEYLAQRCVI